MSESQSERGPHSKLRLDLKDSKVTPLTHAWLPDKQVMSFFSINNGLVKYDPATGKCSLPFENSPASRLDTALSQADRIVEEADEDAPAEDAFILNLNSLVDVNSIIVLKKNLLVVSKVSIISARCSLTKF